MGKIIVCNTKTAQNPYTFLNTKVSVYSYEELCYYLYNNMVLVGEEDVTASLSAWIRRELDLTELADKTAVKKYGSLWRNARSFVR